MRRRHIRGNLWQKIHHSTDPSLFTTLTEDFAALLGLAIAALGLYLTHTFGNPLFDAAASIEDGV
jgi:hypothetical protein